MSISIVILKEIEAFSFAAVLRGARQAAERAGIFCFGMKESFDRSGVLQYLEGALSEVPADVLKSNFEKGIPSRQCGFSIERPKAVDYGSFAWLIQKENYFGALSLEYLGGDFAFAFQFLSHYFNLAENSHDYLWVDDTDWSYSAEDMIWLSRQPYQAAWPYKKLTAPAAENGND